MYEVLTIINTKHIVLKSIKVRVKYIKNYNKNNNKKINAKYEGQDNKFLCLYPVIVDIMQN